MTEQAALDRISALPRFRGGIRTFAPLRALLAALGEPQRALRFVHVAGTNGKGSVCTMTASALCEAGYRVGLYTSPYINIFRERFQIDGKPIGIPSFLSACRAVFSALAKLEAAAELSQFDVVTAIGLLIFAEAGCDIVVLECGLGGRLDATNVIDAPLVAAITNIGYDHTDVLGKSIEEITAEKCGILKSGTSAAVLAPQDYPAAIEIFESHAFSKGIATRTAHLSDISLLRVGFGSLVFTYRGKQYRTRLAAPYQAKNAATALEILFALRDAGLKIDDGAIERGLVHAFIPARLELCSLSPNVLLDGAHNPDGMRSLQNTMEILSNQYERLFCLLGVLEDKNPSETLEAFFDSPLLRSRLGGILTLTPPTPRAATAEALAAILTKMLPGVPVAPAPNAREAIVTLLSQMGKQDVLLAFGSLYTMGELRRILSGLEKELSTNAN